jgi:hypothetical protein
MIIMTFTEHKTTFYPLYYLLAYFYDNKRQITLLINQIESTGNLPVNRFCPTQVDNLPVLKFAR